jgi:hypothetical protein
MQTKAPEIRAFFHLARLLLNGLDRVSLGRMNMTNLGSIAGGALWLTVASLLMMAALEPVSVEPRAPALMLAHAPASPAATAA